MSALAEPLAVPEAPPSGTDRRGIGLISVAHVFNDANQSALPAILPFIVGHHGLTLASAATLVLAMNLSSSVVQPLFGYWSDKRSLSWAIPVSLVVATAGTAAIGLAPTFPLMLLAALVAGVGIAAFHPDASRYANYFAGAKRATGMGWFSVGGYGGFALGPIIVTPLLLAFGLHGTAFIVIPGVVMAAVLAANLPRFERARALAQTRAHHREGSDDWRGFTVLSVVVALRSMAFFAGVTFLPLFAIAVAHVSRGHAAAPLSAMLLVGVGGTLLGGNLADRFDRRSIVVVSLALTIVFAAALALAGAFAPNFALIVVLAGAFGFGLSLSASVLVVLGQEYLPKRIGVASGMTLGLAVTLGGIAAPFFGWIGDGHGLVAVFVTVAVIATVTFAGTLFLPKIGRHVSSARC